MLKKKCSACDKKVDRKYNYCPYCGDSLKMHKERDYGMLGVDDKVSSNNIQNIIRMPFGMGKIVDSLVRQLEKQMENMDVQDIQEMNNMMPKGFKIKISTGKPQMKQQIIPNPTQEKVKFNDMSNITDKEKKRRDSLERVEAISKVRRLADKIIYEIDAPGIRQEKDVVITELASGLEIKIYSKEKCYVKFIPLKVEVIGYRLDKDRVLVELKN